MEYRTLGRTGTKVSTLCLGAMTFGEPTEGSFMHGIATPAEESHRILERALEAGVNFVDTADVYGNDGLSERVLGDWFSRTGRREEVVLASKFRFRMGQGPLGTGASRRRVRQAVEASLRRLQTDYIDLYQVHMQDIATPEEEVLSALKDLVREGKVLYYGCSNYAAYRLVKSDWIADKRGYAGHCIHQAQYSLAERSLEREHLPYQQEAGVGTLPWSPLAGGLLSGKYRKGEAAPAGTRMSKWTERLAGWDTERNWAIVDALRAAAGELETTPAAVALAWVRDRPTVTSVIIGVRDMGQLEANLEAGELTLPDPIASRLEEVSRPDWGYPYGFIQQVDGRW